jgi:hypothetical protein
MSVEVNGYFLRERLDVGNLAAGGAIGTAAATVDIVSDIGVAQTTPGQTITLPAPTDPRNGRSVSVANTGTVPFLLNGISIGPGSFSAFEWHGTTWRTHVGLAGSDFWRDTTTARNVPDGTVDVSEGIVHTGAVHMGSDGVAGEQGFHHEAIVSYQGNGNYVNQLIQTTIPADSSIMPTVFLKGYCYGTSDTVDLQVSFYVYGSPTSTTLNHVWTSSGSKTPTQIRLGYVGGFMAIELTWAAAEYFNRFEVSAYCDGNSAHQAEWFQGWTVTSAVMPGTVVNPVVATRKYAATVPERDLQDRFLSQAATLISLANQIRWAGFYHIMSKGTHANEPAGHFRIDMPADGFAIPVADGTTRAVVASIAGSSVDTGGIPLNIWESLWYKHPKGAGAGSVPANFLIVPYTANTSTQSIILESDDWIRIATRDDSSTWTLGNGDTTTIGGQIGRGAEVTAANWTAMKQRVMGSGYFFSPGGNTAVAAAFGFTGTIRWIDGGSTPVVNTTGYKDASNRTVGLAVRGVNGAADRAWRLMTAAEKPGWFGGAQRGTDPILAASTVVDLNDNETLFYVPAIASGSADGQWVVSGYSGALTVPVHWLPVASRQVTGAHSTIQVLLGGVQYALKAGEAKYTSTNDSTIDSLRRAQTVQFNGPAYCRFTTAAFFAGAAANGLLGGPSGVMVSWDPNRLMYGISDGYASFGNQYNWLEVPTAGTAIPVVSTSSNITRVVQTIGGHRYIPLGTWEALYWIPPSYSGGSNSADGDWVISYYGTGNQHVPPSAVLIAKVFSGPAGSGNGKTRVKFADGSYIQPGLSLATTTVAENDHAQGSGDWRAVVAAGQTGPGMTAALPAIAGISNGSAVYNIRVEMSDPRPTVVLDGGINITAAVPDSTIIGFLPGVKTRSSGQITGVTIRHAGNNTVPSTGFVTFENNTSGGQNGTFIRLYGASAGNVAAQNGGAHGGGGYVSLAGLHFHHA